MFEIVNEKYCKDNLVQLAPASGHPHIIADAEEILYYKKEDQEQALIDKYAQNPKRVAFPFSKELLENKKCAQLFEYDKPYFQIVHTGGGMQLRQLYFFRGRNRAIYYKESINLDERTATPKSQILSREEVEKIFDYKSYDSMYLFDTEGNIMFAKSKREGVVVKRKIIPNDAQLVEMERKSRIEDYKVLCAAAIGDAVDTPENKKDAYAKKTIDEIEEYKLYAPAIFLRSFIDIMLVSKDGKWNAMWFKLVFVKKDTFKLTSSIIPISKPTVDDLIDYSRKHSIKELEDPILPETHESIKQAIASIPNELPEIILEAKESPKAKKPKFQFK